MLTEFIPDQRFVEKSSSTMVGTWEYTFAAEGRGTRVTMQHRQRGIWNVPPLRYLTDFLTPRLSASYLDAVRAQLEGELTVPGQRKPAAAKRRKVAATR